MKIALRYTNASSLSLRNAERPGNHQGIDVHLCWVSENPRIVRHGDIVKITTSTGLCQQIPASFYYNDASENNVLRGTLTELLKEGQPYGYNLLEAPEVATLTR